MLCPADWKPVPWGVCKYDPDINPERLDNLLGVVALIQMINFNRAVPGVARSNPLQLPGQYPVPPVEIVLKK